MFHAHGYSGEFPITASEQFHARINYGMACEDRFLDWMADQQAPGNVPPPAIPTPVVPVTEPVDDRELRDMRQLADWETLCEMRNTIFHVPCDQAVQRVDRRSSVLLRRRLKQYNAKRRADDQVRLKQILALFSLVEGT
jgi:hypothetical protein